MKSYLEMTPAELQAEHAAVSKAYEDLKAVPRKLDMSRGKPNRRTYAYLLYNSGHSFSCKTRIKGSFSKGQSVKAER